MATSTRPDGWLTHDIERETGLALSQHNGEAPNVLLSAHAPGDHGISFLRTAQADGLVSDGVTLHHTLMISTGSGGFVSSRIDSKRGSFVPAHGTAAILPAGSDCQAAGNGSCDIFLMLIPADTVAFAAAERAKAGSSVVETISVMDGELLRLGNLLARQICEGFVDDPIAWYELTDEVVHRLIDSYLSEAPVRTRGTLDERALARVFECIHANIDRAIGVDEIADAAGQSWSHFPRLFRRSVGMSPYQYVVRVRLRHAIELLRSKRFSIAEVAVRSGFADQSHFCRWLKRAFGTSPSILANAMN
jgi:AraC family transcriptional regulator